MTACHRHRRYRLASCAQCAEQIRAQIADEPHRPVFLGGAPGEGIAVPADVALTLGVLQ